MQTSASNERTAMADGSWMLWSMGGLARSGQEGRDRVFVRDEADEMPDVTLLRIR